MNKRKCFRAVAALSMVVLAFSLAGCGDGKTAQELEELRKEVEQMKGEIRELRNVLTRRQMREGDMRRSQVERADRFERVVTNGVSRMRHTMSRPTREEMEARRKMMQDPEMRKKLEAERKARMDERRRLHEARRREIEELRRAHSATNAVAPAK